MIRAKEEEDKEEDYKMQEGGSFMFVFINVFSHMSHNQSVSRVLTTHYKS